MFHKGGKAGCQRWALQLKSLMQPCPDQMWVKLVQRIADLDNFQIGVENQMKGKNPTKVLGRQTEIHSNESYALGVRSFFRAKTEFRQSNCLIMVKWTVKFTDLG